MLLLHFLFGVFFFFPLFFCIILVLIGQMGFISLRYLAVLGAMFLLILFILIFLLLPNSNIFQYIAIFEIVLIQTNCFFTFCVDQISFIFIGLGAFILYFCVLSCWYNSLYNFNCLFYVLLFFQEMLLHFVFLCFDLFLFFFFFESLLLTLFLLVGIFGTRRRKVRAGFLLLLYTIFGSILIVTALCYLYMCLGSTCFLYLFLVDVALDVQKFLWLSLFLTFAVKVPMLPFHIWLPEAHVEAPTVGSVFLAGILLKVGTYGFLRFVLCLFPKVSFYFYPLICTLCICGLLYSSLCAICQLDIKRVIAYSSISHMNVILLGLFSFDLLGIEGSVLQMVNHGVVSGGLFLAIGVLYERFHTRMVRYISGLVGVMPVFTFFFIILILSNIAIPGTCSFIGEFLIFLSLFENNGIVMFFSLFCMVLSGIYSLWLYNRICFGNINNHFILKFNDINVLEICLFILIAFFIIGFGIVCLFTNSAAVLSTTVVFTSVLVGY